MSEAYEIRITLSTEASHYYVDRRVSSQPEAGELVHARNEARETFIRLYDEEPTSQLVSAVVLGAGERLAAVAAEAGVIPEAIGPTDLEAGP